jgi:hypothetical protein
MCHATESLTERKDSPEPGRQTAVNDVSWCVSFVLEEWTPELETVLCRECHHVCSDITALTDPTLLLLLKSLQDYLVS